jgi:tetrahydromethanopterin S-methyltransferase subunit E
VIWKKAAILVYCTKCSAENEENATVCINCKAALKISSSKEKSGVKSSCCDGIYGYRSWGGALAGVIIGIIVILIGFGLLLRQLYGISLPWFEFIMIIFGIYLVIRALRMNRKH